MPEIETSFLCPFSYATLGEGEHNSGDQLCCILGLVRRLSATGDSQRNSRESIRANHSQLKPLLL